MSIEFECYACGKMLRVPEGSEGKMCRCPGCQTALDIPIQDSVIDALSEIECPKCAHTLLYSPELEGTRGLCKACNHIFTISSKSQVEANNDGSFPFECPSCQHLFEGKQGMQGKRGKCDQCGTVFEIKPTVQSISVNLSNQEKRPSNGPSSSQRSRTIDNAPATIKKQPQKRKPTSAAPTSNAPASPALNVQKEPPSVWDTLDLPSANWQTGSGSLDQPSSNPYAMSGGTIDRQFSNSGLFGRCFKLAQKNLVMSTIMMLVAYILSSLAMMFVVAIPAGILIFLGDTLAVRTWPKYAVFIFLVVAAIPMFAILFYSLPGYWNIAIRAVRGKEIGLDAASEKAHLAPQFLGWAFVASLAPGLICAIVCVLFFAMMFGAASLQSPALVILVVLLFYAVIGLAYFLAATPFMLAPFALIDGHSLIDAVSLSIRLCGRNAGTFYLLTLVAMAIGILVSLLSCGVLSTFGMTFLLMNHAAFYKLTCRSAQFES